jgi:hypothetical protein
MHQDFFPVNYFVIEYGVYSQELVSMSVNPP